jgi:hypothetical protein
MFKSTSKLISKAQYFCYGKRANELVGCRENLPEEKELRVMSRRVGVKASLLCTTLLLCAGTASSDEFHGYACYDGCPELKAGYKWAEDQDVRDPYACGGKSMEFNKGCAAYVYERGPAPPPDKDGHERSDEPDRRDSLRDDGKK